MHMDIFDDDAFSAVTMTAALKDVEFKPDLISSLGLFGAPVPITTESVSVERTASGLSIIATTERGTEPVKGKRDRRNIRRFETSRLAKSINLKASEIQGIREFGDERDLETMVTYVGRHQAGLLGDVEATWENMQLGAVQGAVLDADGSVIYDWFAEWNIARPAPIDFDLLNPEADPEQTCREITRRMARNSKGGFTPRTRVVGLAGDKFFDALTTHAKVRQVYLNTAQAAVLNRAFGAATQSAFEAGSYAVFDFGGILFINYRGTDDFDSDATLAGTATGTEMLGIPNTRCKFFPMNARGLFQRAFSPGESFDFVNTIGQELYSNVIRDSKRNAWVEPELYSYPIYICTRPEVLEEGKLSAAS